MASNDKPGDRLRRAVTARDPGAFEDALAFAHQGGLSPDLAGILAEALLMPWHQRHEDVALALQRLREPVAVDALYEAALSEHAYLEYDEFFALARKCTWALADIGTAEAKRRLEDLASSKNTTISGYARRRLDMWEKEQGRKVPHRG
jgi:hypothetical protein